MFTRRRRLLQRVWRSEPEWKGEATVTEHVHRLRHKLETGPSRPQRLPAALLHGIVGAQIGITFGALDDPLRDHAPTGSPRRAELTSWLAAPHAPRHQDAARTWCEISAQNDICCLVCDLPLAS